MEIFINISGNWQASKEEIKISILNSNRDKGKISFDSGLKGEIKTSPEELFAGAFLGSYLIQLNNFLKEEQYVVEDLNSEALIIFENGCIFQISLNLKGKISGIQNSEFKRIAEKAKFVCPISELMDSKIILSAEIV